MRKVLIIGSGVAGLTAGILLQKAGYETHIFEKNTMPGGLCTGWKREQYWIDGCLHWFTGAKKGSKLNELWKEVGALGDGIEMREKESFFSAELGGACVTFWRELEKTRKELLKLSPEDRVEINKMINLTKKAQCMIVPVDKPLDKMGIRDYIEMSIAMKEMPQVLKEYEKQNMQDFAKRFKHPAIRQALLAYMDPKYPAYSFICSYATVSSGDGDLPAGGSFGVTQRMARKYQKLGGILHTNCKVKKVMLKQKVAIGIVLENGKTFSGDEVICASDPMAVFPQLLDDRYMPKKLRRAYKKPQDYHVNSAVYVAFAVKTSAEIPKETRIISCKPIKVGKQNHNQMILNNYSYEAEFAPEGKTIIQVSFHQNKEDATYWINLRENQEEYKKIKKQLANEVLSRMIERYPTIKDDIRVIDCWTPATFNRYCGAYQGAYMGFVHDKKVKKVSVTGKAAKLKNTYLASQWMMNPGGIPIAAAQGKYAAWRIIHKKGVSMNSSK